MTIAAASEDKDLVNLEIAKFRQEFDLKLSAAQKNILNATGSIDDIDEKETNSTKSGTAKESSATPIKTSKKVPFKILDWNKFKLDKVEYSVEFTPYNIEDEDSAPYTLLAPSGDKLPIYIFLKHPVGKIIENALKSKDKNESSKLICSLLVFEAIEKLMQIHSYTKKEITIVKNEILGN